MLAVEEKQKRAPYRTKKWWAQYDNEMSRKFPIGEFAKCHRGRAYVNVKILTRCCRGKIEVLNMVTGAQYLANVDTMIPPQARSPDAMRAALAPAREAQAQEQSARRSRPTVLKTFLQPILDADRRKDIPTYRDQGKLLPLSTDELTAYSALGAINKTLNNLHLNRDSFRNPKLFDLLKAAHTCLETCVKEMESYTDLPEEA